jgi:hypothetical protein
MIYLAIISLEETFAYSGYSSMPTMFFIGGIARRVDMHILTKGKGNFGPWGVLDWICGTTVGDDTIEDDLRDGMDEFDVDEKVDRVVESSKRRAREIRAKRRNRRYS